MAVGEIFISHTHADRGIADALSAAIKDTSGPHVVGVKISRGVLSMGGMGAAPPK